MACSHLAAYVWRRSVSRSGLPTGELFEPFLYLAEKTVLSNERYPSYHFQSTSSYAPIVGQTSYTADTYDPMQNAAPNRARKSSPWDEDPQDDDDSNLPIGVTDNPLPIGEPWALFGMLICYLFYTKRKKIQKKFAQFRKM